MFHFFFRESYTICKYVFSPIGYYVCKTAGHMETLLCFYSDEKYCNIRCRAGLSFHRSWPLRHKTVKWHSGRFLKICVLFFLDIWCICFQSVIFLALFFLTLFDKNWIEKTCFFKICGLFLDIQLVCFHNLVFIFVLLFIVFIIIIIFLNNVYIFLNRKFD